MDQIALELKLDNEIAWINDDAVDQEILLLRSRQHKRSQQLIMLQNCFCGQHSAMSPRKCRKVSEVILQ